jgi:large subunit ribosomal protein L9
MKVILLKDVEKLGSEGELVTVKNGFGRNYLIPQGMALQATAGAIRNFEETIRQRSRKLMQAKTDAEKLAGELSRTEAVVAARVGEEDRIFGTITTTQVAAALESQGFTLDRRKIELLEDIKHIGVYAAQIKLHPEVTASFKVRVEPEVVGSL